MRILIINNGTKHITALKHMLKKHSLVVEYFDQIHTPSEKFNLIILTGSSWYSVIENPEKYTQEIKIIKEYKTPIIGICLGCELIAYVFGAILKKLPERERSITKIRMVKNNFLSDQLKFSAYEAHEWAIRELSEKIMALAISKDGFEIIKVKYKNIWGLQFHPEMLRRKIKGYKIFAEILRLIELHNRS